MKRLCSALLFVLLQTILVHAQTHEQCVVAKALALEDKSDALDDKSSADDVLNNEYDYWVLQYINYPNIYRSAGEKSHLQAMGGYAFQDLSAGWTQYNYGTNTITNDGDVFMIDAWNAWYPVPPGVPDYATAIAYYLLAMQSYQAASAYFNMAAYHWTNAAECWYLCCDYLYECENSTSCLECGEPEPYCSCPGGPGPAPQDP